VRSFLHLLRRKHDPARPSAEITDVAAGKKVQSNRPVFKAPSLPTPQPVPFSADFRKKSPRSR